MSSQGCSKCGHPAHTNSCTVDGAHGLESDACGCNYRQPETVLTPEQIADNHSHYDCGGWVLSVTEATAAIHEALAQQEATIQQLRDERDQLAAQVEVMRGALELVYTDLMAGTEQEHAVYDALSTLPHTALAQIEAEAGAKALEDAEECIRTIQELKRWQEIADWLRDRAAALRATTQDQKATS